MHIVDGTIRSVQTYLLNPNEDEVLHFLRTLSADYPSIEDWYVSKVQPGLFLGSRRLLVLERENRIAAVGIAKNEDGEKKICTVRVAPQFEGKGYGIRLFDKLMDWLQTEKPLLSVSDRNLPKFIRIFDRYGFRQTSIHLGIYREGQRELFFNEAQHVQ